MSIVPDSFKAQINQGVPGNVKARPDPLPAGKKIAANKKLPCEFDTSFDSASTKVVVNGRDSNTASAFEEVETALAAGDYSTAIRILYYLKLNTFINEDSANVWAYAAFAFAQLGFAEHVGFALKKIKEAGLDQTVLKSETMTELKKVSK
ncbi:CIC11C00000004543 [Sungouiella intermedia]|uniref:CIC11C00000004543 n=1 Tax=Sungouiella intermedia TaxID=45354 RepID=A0A1L0GPA5_9ASCO|nr:CIC11C00000004543 [[Candida] intermedia]